MFLVLPCPFKMMAQIALLSHSFILKLLRSTRLVIEVWLPCVLLHAVIAVCLVLLSVEVTRMSVAEGCGGLARPP